VGSTAEDGPSSNFSRVEGEPNRLRKERIGGWVEISSLGVAKVTPMNRKRSEKRKRTSMKKDEVGRTFQRYAEAASNRGQLQGGTKKKIGQGGIETN